MVLAAFIAIIIFLISYIILFTVYPLYTFKNIAYCSGISLLCGLFAYCIVKLVQPHKKRILALNNIGGKFRLKR